jgi:MYXO-CTERM domain-containing protein
MRPLGVITASVLLLAASSAYAAPAKITDVTGDVNNGISLNDNAFQYFKLPGSYSGDGGGGNWNSFVNIGSKAVTFESANASSGLSVIVASQNTVQLNITNNSGHLVNPTLDSTITPAGFGFYVANNRGDCLYSACSPSSSGTFADFHPSGDGYYNLAGAGFQFEIFDGETSIYKALGSVSLTGDYFGTYLNYAFNDTALGLTLHPELGDSGAEGGSLSEFGFNWNAKDIDLNLAALGAGESRTITYRTSVYSYSTGGCTDESTCLVAYSGFGDPIGRGGGVDSLALPFGISALGLGDGGLNFTSVTYEAPTFDDETGQISFNLAPQTSGAPEPAAWAFMLLGFGALGSVLRRQRNPRYI